MRALGCAFIRLYNKKCKVLISLPSLNFTVSFLFVWLFCVFFCSTWQRFYWNINSLLSKTEFYPPILLVLLGDLWRKSKAIPYPTQTWRAQELITARLASHCFLQFLKGVFLCFYPSLFLHILLINLYCWWIILHVTEPELFVDSSSPSCWANRHVPSVASGYENIVTFRGLWNPFDFFIDMFHIHTFINMKSSHSFDVGKWNFNRFTQKISKIEFVMY